MRGEATLLGDGEVRVFGVHHDSRRVEPGDLFVARRGRSSNGVEHVPLALERGAVAVLASESDVGGLSTAVPRLSALDVPKAMAYAASAIYGHPSFTLAVVGITGTNGKTTTSHLVRTAVDAASFATTTGVIGTVGHMFADLKLTAAHTTPESDEIARVMAMMVKRGATTVAMEVSSIAIAERRVDAVHFRVAAFTNFTQDHLDYHGSMEAYGAAKTRLFTELAPGQSVVCVDEPFGRNLASSLSERNAAGVITVSTREGARADFAPIDASFSATGIVAHVRTPRGTLELISPLVGRHNLENLLVALAIVHALDLDPALALPALASEKGAPGRLERVSEQTDDVVVLVDYAHTPDALERALVAVRAVTSNRVVCVFGCGGDRDTQKRALMGEAAARFADRVVLTNDNPRTESPEAIARAVEIGLVSGGGVRVGVAALAGTAGGFTIELDRAKAIDAAIATAQPGDVVIVAGKGHEDYQIVGTEKRPFDDAHESRRALEKRRRSNERSPVMVPKSE